MHSVHASAADLEQLTQVLTSALTILDSADWPGSFRLTLRRYLRDVEMYLAQARAQPDDVAPLIWALEAAGAAWGLLALAMSRRHVRGPHDGNLRSRLDEIDRGLRQLVRSRQGE